MQKLRRIGANRIALTAVAALLASAVAAYAATGHSAQSGGGPQAWHSGGPPGGPSGFRRGFAVGPPGAFGGNYVTYAEVHAYKNGKATVTRLDYGTISAVSDSSITVHERDGSDVTIPLDSDTDVNIPGNDSADTSDLSKGDRVVVQHSGSAAAVSVSVMPAMGTGRPGWGPTGATGSAGSAG